MKGEKRSAIKKTKREGEGENGEIRTVFTSMAFVSRLSMVGEIRWVRRNKTEI